MEYFIFICFVCVIKSEVNPCGIPHTIKAQKVCLCRCMLLQGECSFFLMPGESLERGIQNIFVLGEDQGLILKSNENFVDGVSS